MPADLVFQPVTSVAVLAPGQMLPVTVAGVPVLLANLGGQFYAVEDDCTHQKCALSDGFLEDALIICPCHGGSFDLRTGAAVDLPSRVALRTYPVRVHDGRVHVAVPS